MTTPRIHIITAMDRAGLIGKGDALPWRLPADMRFFRATTMGHPVIMGRATWDSLPKVLDGRQNIVLSRSDSLQPEGAERAGSIEEALRIAAGGQVFVIGGARVYEQFLPLADRLYITEIDAEFDGDTWFPDFDRSQWREQSRDRHPPDDRNRWPYAFVQLRRLAATE